MSNNFVINYGALPTPKPMPGNFLAWVKALESGEYRQAKSILTRERKLEDGNSVLEHCCLGVACFLHSLADSRIILTQSDNDPEDDPTIREKMWVDESDANIRMEGTLSSDSTRAWLGITSDNGAFSVNMETDPAWVVNQATERQISYYGALEYSLTSVNDNPEGTFLQIAYICRTHPELWDEGYKSAIEAQYSAWLKVNGYPVHIRESF